MQVRLSEALARMRLSPTVERGDVAEALRLIKVGDWGGWGVKGAATSGLQRCAQPSACIYHVVYHLPVTGRLLPGVATDDQSSEGRLVPWHDSKLRVSWAAPLVVGCQVHDAVALELHTTTPYSCALSGSPLSRRLPCSRLQQTQPQVSTGCPSLLPVSG